MSKIPTKIIFTRHGKTKHNELGLLQGVVDSVLSEAGKQHANLVAHKILSRFESELNTTAKIRPISIMSSNLSRTIDTASIIQEVFKESMTSKIITKQYPSLRERNYGQWANKPSNDFFDQWLSRKNDQHYPWDDQSQPEVETYREVAARIHNFLFEISNKHQGETIIAVSHGAVMHTLLLLADNFDVNFYDARKIYNMAQIVLEITGPVNLIENDNLLKLSNIKVAKTYDLYKS
jgi:broad specificity phosphatase PhoE